MVNAGVPYLVVLSSFREFIGRYGASDVADTHEAELELLEDWISTVKYDADVAREFRQLKSANKLEGVLQSLRLSIGTTGGSPQRLESVEAAMHSLL